jgi:hypothetical protein
MKSAQKCRQIRKYIFISITFFFFLLQAFVTDVFDDEVSVAFENE